MKGRDGALIDFMIYQSRVIFVSAKEDNLLIVSLLNVGREELGVVFTRKRRIRSSLKSVLQGKKSRPLYYVQLKSSQSL